MNQYTIYDIAKMAGVSPSTVSRVITNNPHVKKATRSKVMKLIRDCHYVPNETARGLVTQNSKLIGILIADIRQTHHTNGVYYIERELAKHGYCCLILNTGTDPEEHEKYIPMLRQRKVESVVLMGSIYQNNAVKTAIENYLPDTPIVIFNGYLDLPNVYGLMADEENGVKSCVELLCGKGRRNLAFVVDRYTPSNLAKQNGFESGVKQLLDEQTPLIVKTNGEWQDTYDVTVRLMHDHPNTDGIIFADDLMATVGLRALTDMKIAIPGQVSVIGINNSMHAANSIPPLTSLDNMLYDLSLQAARNLETLFAGDRVNKKLMICSEIVERQTT